MPFLRFAACMLSVAVCVVDVQAQNRPAQPRNINPAELRDTTLTGKYFGIQQGVMQVKDNTEHPYLINLSLPKCTVTVTGTAKVDFLKPGTLISFTAELDDKNVAAEPVKALAILAPLETNSPIVTREDRDNKESKLMFVRGRVKTIKDGKVTVSAGAKLVQATIPEDANIKFESVDPSLAPEGSPVTITGKLYREFRSVGEKIEPGQIFGERIEITLAEPLTADSLKKKPKKPAGK